MTSSRRPNRPSLASPLRIAGGRVLGEAWQFIALARSDVIGRGLDDLEVVARDAAAGDRKRRARAEAVLAALETCRLELERDPCTGPLPQSEVALGRALAALGPVERTGGGMRGRVSDTVSEAIMTLAELTYDLAEKYPHSKAREAVLAAAHALEREDEANWRAVELDRRLRGLGAAVWRLAPWGWRGLFNGWRRGGKRHARRA